LAVGTSDPPLDPWHYRFAPAEMMLFGAGGLSYFAGRFMQNRLPHSVREFGPILCLAILAIYIVDVPYVTSFLHHALGKSFSSILWLANPGFLVLVAVACPALFNRWSNIPWDGFLGELSFPIYISHTFVAEALQRTVPGGLLPDNLLYVACVIVFSWALFVFVGRPVDRLRASLGARVPNAPGLHGFAAAKNLAP
jgi:peptidoglycan/LPS O-acetylase OafA/YrhL